MANSPFFKVNVRELLNNISPGAARAMLGDIIVGLQEKVAELEAGGGGGEGGTITAADISDATTIGRSILTAEDAEAVKTLLGIE